MQDDMDRKTPREVALDARPGDVLRLQAVGATPKDLRVIGRTQHVFAGWDRGAVQLELECVELDGASPKPSRIAVPTALDAPPLWTLLAVPAGTEPQEIHAMQIVAPVKVAGVMPKAHGFDDVVNPDEPRDQAKIDGYLARLLKVDVVPARFRHMDLVRDVSGPFSDRGVRGEVDRLFETIKGAGEATKMMADNLDQLRQHSTDPAQAAAELDAKAAILEAQIAETERRIAERSDLPPMADPPYPEWANVPDAGEILALGEGISHLNYLIGRGIDDAEASTVIDYLVAALRRIQSRLGGERSHGRMYASNPFETEICAGVRPSGVRLATAPGFVPWWRVFAGTVTLDRMDQAEATK